MRRASELLARHEASLRGTARSCSAGEQDAEDALQRAIEILLSRAPGIEGGPLLAWMRVVVRREALRIGRDRRRLLEHSGFEPDRHAASGPTPEQALGDRERVADAARLLARLKPQERRALALQAAGCSYAEIGAITGWTQTKVNRCLTEGRAALRRAGSLEPARSTG